jgi:hypothetical protein
MKMNRRTLFGAAAGAAVAGTTGSTEKVNPYLPHDWGAKSAGTPVDDAEWRAGQLAKIRRLAAGGFTDEDRCYPTDGHGCPYAPLKSISDSGRRFLRNRNYDRQWERRTMETAIKALADYDKTGILRGVIF